MLIIMKKNTNKCNCHLKHLIWDYHVRSVIVSNITALKNAQCKFKHELYAFVNFLKPQACHDSRI